MRCHIGDVSLEIFAVYAATIRQKKLTNHGIGFQKIGLTTQ